MGRSKVGRSSIAKQNLEKEKPQMTLGNLNTFRLPNLDDKINPGWLENINLCCSSEKKSLGGLKTFVNKIINKVATGSNGITIAEERGLGGYLEKRDLPEVVEFPLHTFNILRYLSEDRKLNLMTREIDLFHIISAVCNGLSVCRTIGLPHGNISPSSIYKRGKFEWEISPPLYSKISLEKRVIPNNMWSRMGMNFEEAVEFLIPPEGHVKLNEIRKSNFC